MDRRPAVLDAFRRARYLVVAVLCGHLLLISAQVVTKSGATVLEGTLFGVFANLQGVTSWAVGQLGGLWSGYFALRGVRDENDRLRQQISEMQVRLQEERALARRSERLQLLLGFRSAVPQRTLAADVIGADATVWFRTVTINRGANDGVLKDMAVISPRGVVGRVVDQPSPHAARVQLLVDRNAAVGVLVERTRTGGIAVGDQDGRGLRLEYVPPAASIAVGDMVVTSGLDGIYPKGFVVGRITGVERVSGGFGTIAVQPAVDFSALEELLVVVSGEGPRTVTDKGAE